VDEASDLSDHHHPGLVPRIYSVGYEGLAVSALIDRLASAHVTRVIDVRLNPVSRRPGFSRKTLSAALEEAGIAYVHEKDLGNPPDNRENFRRRDGDEGRRRLREMLDHGSGPALRRLVDQAQKERIAVLCVEREHVRCHRQVITEMAREFDPRIEVSLIQ
jgi:uncharacterized protein (DUF488 family)